MNMNLSKLREMVMDREAWRAAVHGVEEGGTLLSNWTELNKDLLYSTGNSSQYSVMIYLEKEP